MRAAEAVYEHDARQPSARGRARESYLPEATVDDSPLGTEWISPRHSGEHRAPKMLRRLCGHEHSRRHDGGFPSALVQTSTTALALTGRAPQGHRSTSPAGFESASLGICTGTGSH